MISNLKFISSWEAACLCLHLPPRRSGFADSCARFPSSSVQFSLSGTFLHGPLGSLVQTLISAQWEPSFGETPPPWSLASLLPSGLGNGYHSTFLPTGHGDNRDAMGDPWVGYLISPCWTGRAPSRQPRLMLTPLHALSSSLIISEGGRKQPDRRHKGHGGECGISPSFPSASCGILPYPTLSCLTELEHVINKGSTGSGMAWYWRCTPQRSSQHQRDAIIWEKNSTVLYWPRRRVFGWASARRRHFRRHSDQRWLLSCKLSKNCVASRDRIAQDCAFRERDWSA